VTGLDIVHVPDLFAGVELGGTKCICVLATGPGDIRAREQILTSTPAETLARIEEMLIRWLTEHGRFEGVGIASFGPLDLRPTSERYGHITGTPKPDWSNTDIVGRFRRRFGVPIGFNTDVNGAALAEARWGGAKGLDNSAYITVGTGIGVGLMVARHPILGLGHTEVGHVRVVQMAGDDWSGHCPIHGNCVEGIASGPAIAARTGVSSELLRADHPVWESVAFALGQLLHTLVLTMAPQRILMGGGVMQGQTHLFGRVREHLRTSLNGYVTADELGPGLSNYVVPPGLGALAGPLGAIALAMDAAGAV
jgi:fructokinase